MQSRTSLLFLRTRALADPIRLRILHDLPNHEDLANETCTVTRLAANLQIPQPLVSHHLAVLRRAGLVRNKRVFRNVFYWTDLASIDSALSEIRDRVTAPETQTISPSREKVGLP